MVNVDSRGDEQPEPGPVLQRRGRGEQEGRQRPDGGSRGQRLSQVGYVLLPATVAAGVVLGDPDVLRSMSQRDPQKELIPELPVEAADPGRDAPESGSLRDCELQGLGQGERGSRHEIPRPR